MSHTRSCAALLVLAATALGCGRLGPEVRTDAGAEDAASLDGSGADAGAGDAASLDGGGADTGVGDTGVGDAGDTGMGTLPITQRGTATTADIATTSVTVAMPTGVVAGDVLIANLEQSGDSVTDPTSPGWTLISGVAVDAGGRLRRGAVLYRVAGASEPADYRFTLGAAVIDGSVAILAFSGVDTTGGFLVGGGAGGPFDVAPGTVVAPMVNALTATAPSIATSSPNAAVVMLVQMMDGTPGAAYSGWTTTSPGALTEVLDFDGATSRESIGAAWALMATPGSTGVGTVALSDVMGAKKWGAILLALRPL